MDTFILILNPPYVCWDLNVLPFAFLEKLLGRFSMDVNKSSEYYKTTFRSHENHENHRLTLENCKSDSLKAVVGRCSVNKVFLKVLSKSQESTCVRVSFLIKLQA